MSKLFYIMGPSGSGKDTFIQALREQWPNDLLVAHRYITRSAAAGGENHIELSQIEFKQRREGQLFSMYWQANQHSYGLGLEVKHWLEQGFDVVMNGSRAYLPSAEEKFGEQLIPIVIHVKGDILEQRLRARGRESEGEILCRLQRAKDYQCELPENAIYIDNSGCISLAIAQFTKHYQGQTKQRMQPQKVMLW